MNIRRILTAGLVVVALLAAVLIPASPASAASAGEFVSKINDLRSSKGLPRLNTDGRLNSQAQKWAEQMAGVNKISHNPNLRHTPGNWKKVGENVGTGGTVSAIFDALVASSSHYHNMVDGDFNHVGVGIANGSDGRIYTAHVFAKYASASATTTTAAPKPTTTTAAPKPTTTAAPKKATTTTVAAAAAKPTQTTAASTPTQGTETLGSPAEEQVPTTTGPHVSQRIATGLSEISVVGIQG